MQSLSNYKLLTLLRLAFLVLSVKNFLFSILNLVLPSSVERGEETSVEIV